MSYNDALKIDQMAGASLDAALADFKLDAIVAPTDSPGWTTDLILADHFLFASSGLAGPPDTRSSRCRRAMCSACPRASASSEPPSVSRR
jgi:hypothetical protein